MVLPSPLPLAKPPIIEALIDVQVAPPQMIDVERLKELGKHLNPNIRKFAHNLLQWRIRATAGTATAII